MTDAPVLWLTFDTLTIPNNIFPSVSCIIRRISQAFFTQLFFCPCPLSSQITKQRYAPYLLLLSAWVTHPIMSFDAHCLLSLRSLHLSPWRGRTYYLPLPHKGSNHTNPHPLHHLPIHTFPCLLGGPDDSMCRFLKPKVLLKNSSPSTPKIYWDVPKSTDSCPFKIWKGLVSSLPAMHT